jgi:hypothetical protein
MFAMGMLLIVTALLTSACVGAALPAGLLTWRGPVAAASPLATPEKVSAAYIDALVAQDTELMRALSAVDNVAEEFDFERYSERLLVMMPLIGLQPSSYPLTRELNRAASWHQLLRSATLFTYSLLTDEEIDGGTILLNDGEGGLDQERLDAFVRDVNPERLAGLQVLAIAAPMPDVMASERYQTNSETIARTYGADEQTERVLLVQLGDATYMTGFTLLRFGSEWKVHTQTSAIAGLPSTSIAVPTDATAFAELTGSE